MYEIEALTVERVGALTDQLIDLLVDAVESGASVGFLPPCDPTEGRAYWTGVQRAMTQGHRVLLAAVEDGRVWGAVQLDFAAMPNARHRAEVMKLLVHRQVRRRGIGRALMQAVERAARSAGRTLLVLDTRRGDAAEALYRSLGYVRAGIIPRYARSASGVLEDTVYLYRELDG